MQNIDDRCRLGSDERRPIDRASALGEGWCVIEEGLCHKLDHSLILSVEQKNLGGNTDRLAPIQKSPIPEFSMFDSRDEMSASGKVVVNGGLD